MCTATPIPIYSPCRAKTPTALALGSFDGLHAGHQRVINAVTKDIRGIPTVVSFWPHPREVLNGEPRLRIDLPSEKASLLGPLGVKQLIMIPFDLALAKLSAQDFIEKMLIKTLNAKLIAVGNNFRFGNKREGSAQTLKQIASSSGIEVKIIPILKDESGRMSSSRIRSALMSGDLDAAKKLMGRPYRFSGEVVRGRGIGKSIGWPTANLEVDGRKFLPALGVYAARIWINNDVLPLPAVMNLGPQPTVDPNSPSAVEVHLLDQQIDLKACELTVEPVNRIRGQQKFENLKNLSLQIGRDAHEAKIILDKDNHQQTHPADG